jgi:SAM-dependent methyltransferase
VNLKQQMDNIYADLPLDKIPWNIEGPPEILVELVESKWIKPCATADVGCGAGNHAIWLASRGFQVTGIDISANAVKIARREAQKRNISCVFKAMDLLGAPGELAGSFDFVYEWEVLHHIFPEDREKYVANIYNLLKPGGKYLSVCFSEEDTDFGGGDKYRKTPIGTTLYFSSEEELKELFEKKFTIHKLVTSKVAGKYGSHQVVEAHLERKSKS